MKAIHAVAVAATLALAGCSATGTVGSGSAMMSDAEAWMDANQNVSSDDVFSYHDTDNDEMLNQSEFANAYNFNPVMDCNNAGAIDDPRCDRWLSTRGPNQ